LIEKVEKLDYQLLLQTHFEKTGKVLQPIQRRNGVKINLDLNTTCPRCNAPSDYLYANNGSKGQCNCKVCDALFNPKNRYSKEAILKCPHCSHPLEKIKDRNGFDVYKCKRADCPYYLRRLKELTPEEKELFEKDSQQFKMHYLFRQFNIPFHPISKDSVIQPKVNLANIHCSPHTLGLILTYHVNYGLSARKTAALMYDVHNVRISGQTILNYASSTSVVLKPFLENYPYELSDQFCGDETYIRVGGRWNYLFFFFDAVKKIILSNYVSPNRDTESAIYALREVFKKMPQIPEDLTFIVDGNPIYLLAQHYYARQPRRQDQAHSHA
jgi:putative transposase